MLRLLFSTLDSVISEQLEAIVPETPRVVHILVSLCRAFYTDVAFLDSVLCVMKPLISYFLRKRTDDEKVMGHLTDSGNFELICFEELFEIVRCGKHSEDIRFKSLCWSSFWGLCFLICPLIGGLKYWAPC